MISFLQNNSDHILQLASFFEISQHPTELGLLQRTRAGMYHFLQDKAELKQGTLYYLFFKEPVKELSRVSIFLTNFFKSHKTEHKSKLNEDTSDSFLSSPKRSQYQQDLQPARLLHQFEKQLTNCKKLTDLFIIQSSLRRFLGQKKNQRS